MKLFFTLSLLFLCFTLTTFGNGVAIVDGSQGTYFQLVESHVEVTVNNQIATTKATHYFKNTTGQSSTFLYAFPLSENVSTTGIRWFNNGFWSQASLIAEPQDSTLPGVSDSTSIATNLQNYLGATPLYYNISDLIAPNAIVKVELTYVELLSYNNNIVEYTHPNHYSLIQNLPLDSLSFNFQVQSARDILNIDLSPHNGSIINNTMTQATLLWQSTGSFLPTADYSLTYELDPNQLGLFSFSTYLPSTPCDSGNTGYFAMIVEPDGGDSTQVIDKVFTLILDVSGSMGGTKIAQARDAATFIVNNMNLGDKFNIVQFSSSATSWQPTHVDANAANLNAAVNYIAGLNSGGGTSFTSAFNTAIPQFTYDTTVANIMIFLTDGRANESDTEVLNTLNGLLNTHNLVENLQIHTFGIGSNVNQSLLSVIANQNSGLASFVGSDDLFTSVSSFYSNIKNPVLLDVQAHFSSAANVYDVFPVDLPNLYKGQQLILAGKYDLPDSVHAVFSGQSFGTPTSFQYDFSLVDTLVPEHLFLTKIWAKMKIEDLMRQYYHAGSDTSITNVLEDSVTAISLCYGVVSPFTSFTGASANSSGNGNSTGYSNNGINSNNSGGGRGTNSDPSFESSSSNKKKEQNAHVFPVPFRSQTTFQFRVTPLTNVEQIAILKIYDAKGRLMRSIAQTLEEKYTHEIVWDGTRNDGVAVVSGGYFYVIEVNGERLYYGRIVKIE